MSNTRTENGVGPTLNTLPQKVPSGVVTKYAHLLHRSGPHERYRAGPGAVPKCGSITVLRCFHDFTKTTC